MLRVTLATNPDSHFSGLGHRQHKRLCCHTRCQGLCTEPAKIETAWANNASGNRHRSDSGGNQKWYAFGVRLTAWLRAVYPLFYIGTQCRMPTPDTLYQLDPLRQEPEHRMTGFARRIRWIAPRPVHQITGQNRCPTEGCFLPAGNH